MARSLAELRAQKDAPKVPQATLTATLIEGQHLLAEAEALYQERVELIAEKGTLAEEKDHLEREARGEDSEGNPTRGPRKAGESIEMPDRVAEIDARLEQITVREKAIGDREAALLPELAEHQADLGLRGMTGGEWQRWKNAHPARDDNPVDVELTAARCDSDALFNALASFVSTWDGEELNDGDWDGWLADRIVYADRVAAVTKVVNMQESRVPKAPKSPTSPATPSESVD